MILLNWLIKKVNPTYYWAKELQKYTKFKVNDLVKYDDETYSVKIRGHVTVNRRVKVVGFEIKRNYDSILEQLANAHYIYFDPKLKVYSTYQISSADEEWELDAEATVGTSFNAELKDLLK